jgi:SnoaL-like protein
VSDPAGFVARFADGWSGPYPERLLALLHPGVRLIQPLSAPITGCAAAERELFEPLFRFLPDLRLAVARWSAEGDVLFIEWTASATLGTGNLRWSGVDRFLLGTDGTALERVAWFDPAPLLVAILRHPSCWWRFVRSGVARRALQNGTGTSTRRYSTKLAQVSEKKTRPSG